MHAFNKLKIHFTIYMSDGTTIQIIIHILKDMDRNFACLWRCLIKALKMAVLKGFA